MSETCVRDLVDPGDEAGSGPLRLVEIGERQASDSEERGSDWAAGCVPEPVGVSHWWGDVRDGGTSVPHISPRRDGPGRPGRDTFTQPPGPGKA